MNRYSVTVIAMALCLASPARAYWTPLGPEGGSIHSGVISRGPDKTILVASGWYNAPMMKSTDCGQTWARIGGVLATPPNAMVGHSTDPSRAYTASSYGRIYETTDGGNSWVELNVPPTAALSSLAVNPADWDEIFAAGRQDLMSTFGHSVDGGQTWETCQLEPAAGTIALAVAVLGSNPDVVYCVGVAGSGMKCYRSSDRGGSWSASTVTSGATYFAALDVNPDDGAELLCGLETGVYRSTNAGATWTRVLDQPGNALVRSAEDHDRVCASAGGSVYQSMDGGATWAQTRSGLSGQVYRCLLIDPDDVDVLYCGTTEGMFRTTDRGANWVASNSGLVQFIYFSDMACSADDPDVVYAAARSCYGLHKTTDGGSTWSVTSSFTGCGAVCGLAVSSQDARRVWVFEGMG
ncbi:hypothetical protein FJY71_04255 [candidate division WOR-3 bacterium]|nr:hypothetical protein [candidate division WOR-3 bacterium]